MQAQDEAISVILHELTKEPSFRVALERLSILDPLIGEALKIQHGVLEKKIMPTQKEILKGNECIDEFESSKCVNYCHCKRHCLLSPI